MRLERDNGGVFQSWLKKSSHANKMDKLMILLDFQCLVEDIEEIEDRLLNLCATWKFFQKYFQADNSKCYVALIIALSKSKNTMYQTKVLKMPNMGDGTEAFVSCFIYVRLLDLKPVFTAFKKKIEISEIRNCGDFCSTHCIASHHSLIT